MLDEGLVAMITVALKCLCLFDATVGRNLMTSPELTSGINFCSCGHLRMAVVYLSIKFGGNIFIESGYIDIFRNSIWRPPSSWIFMISEFGTFRHDDCVCDL